MQQARRAPLSVVATDAAGPGDPPEVSDDVAAVLALIARASGADQAAARTVETAIMLLQEAVTTLQAAADAKDVLVTQVPLPVLRQALAHRAGASRVQVQR